MHHKLYELLPMPRSNKTPTALVSYIATAPHHLPGAAQMPCKLPSVSMKRAKYPMLPPAMAVFGLECPSKSVPRTQSHHDFKNTYTCTRPPESSTFLSVSSMPAT